MIIVANSTHNDFIMKPSSKKMMGITIPPNDADDPPTRRNTLQSVYDTSVNTKTFNLTSTQYNEHMTSGNLARLGHEIANTFSEPVVYRYNDLIIRTFIPR